MQRNRPFVVGLLALALVPSARAQPPHGTAVRPPQFEEYSTRATYSGKHQAPILDADSRMYRTRLRLGAKEKVNFAGHYVFTTWGCGTECFMGAAIDVATGKVFMLPFTVCCWGADGDPFELHLNSRLILFRGERNEDGKEGTWYYRIDDAKGWVLEREVPKPPLGQG